MILKLFRFLMLLGYSGLVAPECQCNLFLYSCRDLFFCRKVIYKVVVKCSSVARGKMELWIENRRKSSKKMLVLLYMNICQHFLAKSSYYEVKICWEENYFFSGQSTEVRDLHHKLLCWCLFMYYSEVFNTLVIPLKNGDDI